MVDVVRGIFWLLTQLPVIVAVLLGALYLVFRNHPAKLEITERFFADFRVGGHRGSPTKQPENTMESMDQAKKEGVDLIEFDVSLTKDNIAVILHDDTLDRTTDLTGAIRDYLHADALKANCAAKFVAPDPKDRSHAAKSAKLPTLDMIIAWAKKNRVKMLFDVKDYDIELVDQLEKFFERYDIYDSSIVCSFFPIVVYRIKRRCPRILTGLTWRRWFYSTKDLFGREPRFAPPVNQLATALDVLNVWSIKTWLPSFLGVDMILTERAEISGAFVSQQAAANRRVCAWTVNDVAEARWMLDVLGIPVLTDKPYLMQPLVAAKK